MSGLRGNTVPAELVAASDAAAPQYRRLLDDETWRRYLDGLYWDAENRFDTMAEIAGKLIDVPTISPLYKPMLGGRTDRYGAAQHVARRPDRVAVTWITTEPDYYIQGVPPERPTVSVRYNHDEGR